MYNLKHRSILVLYGAMRVDFVPCVEIHACDAHCLGGLRHPGQGIHECVQSEFTEEALGSLEKKDQHAEELQEELDLLFAHGIVVFKG